MPNVKEHPLAHRIVVPNGFLLTGETVRVVDWLDRCGEGIGPEIPPLTRVMVRVGDQHFRARYGGENPIPADQAVAIIGRTTNGMLIVPAAELPTYDPVPWGFIS